MLRWLVDLGCGDTAVVLTDGSDPTVGQADRWWCQECGRRCSVKAAHKVCWETVPDLRLRDIGEQHGPSRGNPDHPVRNGY